MSSSSVKKAVFIFNQIYTHREIYNFYNTTLYLKYSFQEKAKKLLKYNILHFHY